MLDNKKNINRVLTWYVGSKSDNLDFKFGILTWDFGVCSFSKTLILPDANLSGLV